MDNKILYSVVLIACFFGFSVKGEARENVTDWYVQDFHGEFVLNSDSSMIVTERIVADCGEVPDKHGIFRIIPTVAHTETGTIETPIELLSITDFRGEPYRYTATVNSSDHTVTWKIGEADTVVTGVHEYQIVYRVKNVIRFGNDQFDEFYWNIGGNFWTIPIDAFTASLVFPLTVHKDSTTLSYYTGLIGSKETDLVTATWQNDHVLTFVANHSLKPGEGVSASVTVPKGIFEPFRLSWWELYGWYFIAIIPIGTGWFAYRTWRKYGDDPTWNKVVIPEYQVPDNLDALELGMLKANGNFENSFITAAIIELAVRGAIRIQEVENKILFFTTKEFVFEKQPLTGLTLLPHQTILLNKLFESGDSVKLSSLKNEFYKTLTSLRAAVVDSLVEKDLVEKKGLTLRIWFIVTGVVIFFLVPFVTGVSSFAAVMMVISGFLILGFGFIMPKRTLKGTEVNWRIQGLRLYMETAEKARQQFYEKEHIFEVLLPAAIVFGMTKEWVQKMRVLYGEEYFSSYHPAWFLSASLNSFDADSFTSHMESLSSSIASSTGTSSGSSGSGSSGGGGGGGGGGGW